MRYQRTQVYLDPEEHRRLVREAAERGLSLAEHIRRLVASRAAETGTAYDVRSFDGIVGIGRSKKPAPDADTDDDASRAFEEEYLRSIRRPAPGKGARP